jgi:hypothetical protein
MVDLGLYKAVLDAVLEARRPVRKLCRRQGSKATQARSGR